LKKKLKRKGKETGALGYRLKGDQKAKGTQDTGKKSTRTRRRASR